MEYLLDRDLEIVIVFNSQYYRKKTRLYLLDKYLLLYSEKLTRNIIPMID